MQQDGGLPRSPVPPCHHQDCDKQRCGTFKNSSVGNRGITFEDAVNVPVGDALEALHYFVSRKPTPSRREALTWCFLKRFWASMRFWPRSRDEAAGRCSVIHCFSVSTSKLNWCSFRDSSSCRRLSSAGSRRRPNLPEGYAPAEVGSWIPRGAKHALPHAGNSLCMRQSVIKSRRLAPEVEHLPNS